MAGLSEEYYNNNTEPAKLGKLIDKQGSDINFQISYSGGLLDLNLGKYNYNGFYITVSGDEGILKVMLMNSNSYVSLPFFNGWNPVLVKEVLVDTGNTAIGIYWGATAVPQIKGRTPILETLTIPTDGMSIVLDYSETLDTISIPATSDYCLSGTSSVITGVTISGSIVTLSFDTAVLKDVVVSASYTGGTNVIRDTYRHNAVNFVSQAITNSSSVEIFSFDITLSDAESFSIPTSDGYLYDYIVDWGDGNKSEQIITFDDSEKAHIYSAGAYTINVYGIIESFYVNNNSAIDTKIIKVNSWGTFGMFKQLNFNGCTNLTELPEEVGKLSNVESFAHTFDICSSLTSIPSGLFDNNINVESFLNTFDTCSSLTSIPSGLFDNNINVIDFTSVFLSCSSLTSIPSGLFDNNINAEIFLFSFLGNTSLISIPSGLFDKNIAVTSFRNTFYNCSSITSIPSGLFDKNINVESFDSTFRGCSSLESIPSGLFDNNIVVTTFKRCFFGCNSLTGLSGELWLNPSGSSNYTLESPDYDIGVPNGMTAYLECIGLSDYVDIPTYWK